MKSALRVSIFGIIGGCAISLAAVEEKPPVLKIQSVNSFPDYGEPLVPQIEETPPQEAPAPEPQDRYLVAQTKTEKIAPRHHKHVIHTRPNFFQKLFAGFIKLQKRPATKSVHKHSRTTSHAAK